MAPSPYAGQTVTAITQVGITSVQTCLVYVLRNHLCVSFLICVLMFPMWFCAALKRKQHFKIQSGLWTNYLFQEALCLTRNAEFTATTTKEQKVEALDWGSENIKKTPFILRKESCSLTDHTNRFNKMFDQSKGLM